ncbi:hypothetical protein WA158_004343 [Blastocystis sp. Blastoise]
MSADENSSSLGSDTKVKSYQITKNVIINHDILRDGYIPEFGKEAARTRPLILYIFDNLFPNFEYKEIKSGSKEHTTPKIRNDKAKYLIALVQEKIINNGFIEGSWKTTKEWLTIEYAKYKHAEKQVCQTNFMSINNVHFTEKEIKIWLFIYMSGYEITDIARILGMGKDYSGNYGKKITKIYPEYTNRRLEAIPVPEDKKKKKTWVFNKILNAEIESLNLELPDIQLPEEDIPSFDKGCDNIFEYYYNHYAHLYNPIYEKYGIISNTNGTINSTQQQNDSKSVSSNDSIIPESSSFSQDNLNSQNQSNTSSTINHVDPNNHSNPLSFQNQFNSPNTSNSQNQSNTINSQNWPNISTTSTYSSTVNTPYTSNFTNPSTISNAIDTSHTYNTISPQGNTVLSPYLPEQQGIPDISNIQNIPMNINTQFKSKARDEFAIPYQMNVNNQYPSIALPQQQSQQYSFQYSQQNTQHTNQLNNITNSTIYSLSNSCIPQNNGNNGISSFPPSYSQGVIYNSDEPNSTSMYMNNETEIQNTLVSPTIVNSDMDSQIAQDCLPSGVNGNIFNEFTDNYPGNNETNNTIYPITTINNNNNIIIDQKLSSINHSPQNDQGTLYSIFNTHETGSNNPTDTWTDENEFEFYSVGMSSNPSQRIYTMSNDPDSEPYPCSAQDLTKNNKSQNNNEQSQYDPNSISARILSGPIQSSDVTAGNEAISQRSYLHEYDSTDMNNRNYKPTFSWTSDTYNENSMSHSNALSSMSNIFPPMYINLSSPSSDQPVNGNNNNNALIDNNNINNGFSSINNNNNNMNITNNLNIMTTMSNNNNGNNNFRALQLLPQVRNTTDSYPSAYSNNSPSTNLMSVEQLQTHDFLNTNINANNTYTPDCFYNTFNFEEQDSHRYQV